MQNKQINILVVDDDDVDIMGLTRVFKKNGITNPLIRAKDGIEALGIINGEDELKILQKPYLIFLDINMPRMNGIEFLDALRKNPKHQSAIVFMLTTSQYDADRVKAYSYNIAGYISKENFIKNTDKVVSLIKSFIEIVDFPE